MQDIDDGIRPQKPVRLGYGHILNIIIRIPPAHDLHPEYVFSGTVIVQYVGTIHTLGRMERTIPVVFVRWNEETFVLPVVEIFRGISPDPPMPDTASGQGLFLVFPVPVERIVFKKDAAPVGLNPAPRSVKPRLAGFD
jgi:hypothetical protein